MTWLSAIMTCSCSRKDKDRGSLGSPQPSRASRRAGSVSRLSEDSRVRRVRKRGLLRSSSLDQYEHLAHFEVEQPASRKKRILLTRETDEETDVTDSVELREREDNRANYRVKLNHSHSKHNQNRRR